MKKQEIYQQLLEKIKKLVQTTPRHGQEEDWVVELNDLKDELKKSFSPTVQHKFNRIDLDCYMDGHPFDEGYLFSGLSVKSQKMLTVLLEDEIFYYSENGHPDEQYLRKKKLIEARRESADFEDDLASIICGDNQSFPYRSSWYITKFLQDNGYNYQHDGTTRSRWIASILCELNIHDIYLITEAVFKRKYFVDFAKNKELDLDQLIVNARKSFAEFIENSISANKTIDLSPAFKLNVNFELLSNKITTTEDQIFNELIDSAKNFYIEGNKQEAIEKVWDAFERLKTILKPEDKKKSAQDLVELLSVAIHKPFFENEFKTLTEVGNDYMIRHSEVGKIVLTDNSSKDYLFFRVLALIDLAIQKLPKA